MGDRVNVVIVHSNARGIALYGHWAGERTPETVRRIVSDAPRRDADYFTRYAFMQFVRDGYADADAAMSDALSFGLSPYLAMDREYPILAIDPNAGSIYLVSARDVVTADEVAARSPLFAWTFEEFAGLAGGSRLTWDVVTSAWKRVGA